jgi:hypothetical protein
VVYGRSRAPRCPVVRGAKAAGATGAVRRTWRPRRSKASDLWAQTVRPAPPVARLGRLTDTTWFVCPLSCQASPWWPRTCTAWGWCCWSCCRGGWPTPTRPTRWSAPPTAAKTRKGCRCVQCALIHQPLSSSGHAGRKRIRASCGPSWSPTPAQPWQRMVDPALKQARADVLGPLLALLNRCLSRRADQRPSTRHVLANSWSCATAWGRRLSPSSPTTPSERRSVSLQW